MILSCDVCGRTNLSTLWNRGKSYCNECVPDEPGHVAHVCRLCGAREPNRFIESVKAELAFRRLCHSCNHWLGYARTKSDPTHAVIRGTHYVICEERPYAYKPCLGFGGDRFIVRFQDGREVITTNLWCQGEIPAHFRADLPDNATFGERPRRPRFVGEGQEARHV